MAGFDMNDPGMNDLNVGAVPDMQHLATMLAERVSDPIAAAVIGSMLTQRGTGGAGSGSHERELQQAHGEVQRLRAALSAADAMAAYVADTFGACPACWGLNRFCSRCHGHGTPGRAEPNGEVLLAWVEPAITRLGLQLVPAAQPTPDWSNVQRETTE